MAGGLMQLVAYGAQDIYLTGNPQITFFKVVYRRHTNFSMECIKQNINGRREINGNSSVNNKGNVIISRNGDLVSGIYVECAQNTTYGIRGDYIIEEVEIEIGGQRIDKHYREWNQLWTELTIPVSKSKGFKYMSGSINNNLVTKETNQQIIQYPLNFWFCRNPGLALPLIALQYHDVQLKFTWGTGVYSSDSDNLQRKAVDLSTDTNIELEVWADYIYLDTDERRRFSQVSHEYLIEQVQVQKEKDTEGDIFKLNLEHPVKELLWTTPTANPILNNIKIHLDINGHERFSARNKEYFTLTQPYLYHTSVPGYNIKEYDRPQILCPPINSGITTHNNTSPAGQSTITLASTSITYAASQTIPFKVGDHFITSIEPGSINTNVSCGLIHQVTAVSSTVVTFTPAIPSSPTDGDTISISIIASCQDPQSNCSQLKKDVYVYSFCLEPEEHQPSGTCNFSRIDSAKLIFSSIVHISNIYAVNYNVLRIMSGMAGLAYSS